MGKEENEDSGVQAFENMRFIFIFWTDLHFTFLGMDSLPLKTIPVHEENEHLT